MKGDPKVIAHLNKILRNELTAINQYFLHSRMFDNWGLGKLAKHTHHESVDEMKHADALIKRILFLEGLPNLQDLDKLLIGETVVEVLECDLALERKAHPDLKAAVTDCATTAPAAPANVAAMRKVLIIIMSPLRNGRYARHSGQPASVVGRSQFTRRSRPQALAAIVRPMRARYAL